MWIKLSVPSMLHTHVLLGAPSSVAYSTMHGQVLNNSSSTRNTECCIRSMPLSGLLLNLLYSSVNICRILLHIAELVMFSNPSPAAIPQIEMSEFSRRDQNS